MQSSGLSLGRISLLIHYIDMHGCGKTEDNWQQANRTEPNTTKNNMYPGDQTNKPGIVNGE